MNIRSNLALVGSFALMCGCGNSDVPPDVPTIPWSDSIVYGRLMDSRDGKEYKTIEIGGQTWMAENLNYAGVGKCYDDESAYCAVFGRQYTGYDLGLESNSTKGICPNDWHIPSSKEWLRLVRFVSNDVMIQKKAIETIGSTRIIRDYYIKDSLGAVLLKSSFGWNEEYVALDYYGFRMLPDCSNCKSTGFWTSTQSDRWQEVFWTYAGETYIGLANHLKTEWNSLRCVKDSI